MILVELAYTKYRFCQLHIFKFTVNKSSILGNPTIGYHHCLSSHSNIHHDGLPHTAEDAIIGCLWLLFEPVADTTLEEESV